MRNSKENISIRREKVKLFMSLSFPQHEIARQLSCSPRTIWADIKAIRKGWSSHLQNIDLDQLVSEMKHELDARRRELWNIIQGLPVRERGVIQRDDDGNIIRIVPSAQIKINALKALGDENKRLIELLQSVGKVHREPEKFEGTVRQFTVVSALPRPKKKGSIDVKDLEMIKKKLKLEDKDKNGLIGLCPFHKETAPSFMIDKKNGVYHCFGCGKKGTLIELLEKIKGEK